MIHVKACIVYVDLETQDHLTFELTPETIEELMEYCGQVISSNLVYKNENWAGENGPEEEIARGVRPNLSTNTFTEPTPLSSKSWMREARVNFPPITAVE